MVADLGHPKKCFNLIFYLFIYLFIYVLALCYITNMEYLKYSFVQILKIIRLCRSLNSSTPSGQPSPELDGLFIRSQLAYGTYNKSHVSAIFLLSRVCILAAGIKTPHRNMKQGHYFITMPLLSIH